MTAQELKNSILQLAVQGKLVPQDPNDEPASALLSRIRQEKSKLVQAGTIKKEKPLPPIDSDELPFEIPESWEWVRLGDFCSVYNGNSINSDTKQKKYSQVCKGYCYIATKDVGFDSTINYQNGIYIPENEDNFKIAPKGSVLLCMEGGSAGKKIGILNQDVCFGNKLCCFVPVLVYNKYVYYYQQSFSFYSLFLNSMTGIIGGVGATKIKNLPIPLPPLSEQRRIVERIEELLPIVDRYGEAEEELRTLNVTFPDQLRKSILQQAVQGKLVPQDPNDEPASVLLSRIRQEKSKLVQAGKIKKEKPLPPIDPDELPFEIPNSWEWVRLGDVCTKITDGTHHSPPNYETGEYLYVTAKNIKDSGVSLDNITYVTPEIHNEIYARCNPEINDVLLIKDGATAGIVTVNNIDKPFSMLSSVALLKPCSVIMPWYLTWVLRSNLFYGTLRASMKGAAITRVTLRQIEPMLLPLPPLSEQCRIVERIEELLSLCTALTASVS